MKIRRPKQSNCTLHLLLLALCLRCSLGKTKDSSSNSNQPHTRQKRLLWVTADGRLALPPGTSLVISPSLSFPFVRYPPDGFFSNMTITLPFTIDFNKLGLTDNENPFGVVPPLLARSMGRAAGNVLADYLGSLLSHRSGKRKRSIKDEPHLPESHKYAFHGGERVILYMLSEEFLENFGMNGKACLLRAICEVNAHPLHNLGLLGEMLKLFLSPSKSPYSELLPEYLEAERAGRGQSGPSECWPYMKDCPKSLFLPQHNPYSESVEAENEIENENAVTYDPSIRNM